jgi:predicted transcriptional regulator
VHTAGRKIEEIMTPDPYTVAEDASLEDVVEIMERRHIKRLPVTRSGHMVGIVSRANLMHALASFAPEMSAPAGGDSVIRDNILTALSKMHWAPRVNVVVKNGVVKLWGIITDERERQGIIVVAENAQGVTTVHDHLVWVEPMSGVAIASAEDEAKERAEASAPSAVH